MLDVANTVLLVVDVQEKLARVIDERDLMLSNLKKLIAGMTVLEVPIIVTEQYPQGLGPTVPEIVSLLADLPRLPKASFSCWDDADFRQQLASVRRRQVLISGIETHVCVYQTARDLIAEGFETYVVADAVSSRTLENRQIGLEMMRQVGVRLTSTEATLFELLRIAEGDEFKKISQIVR